MNLKNLDLKSGVMTVQVSERSDETDIPDGPVKVLNMTADHFFQLSMMKVLTIKDGDTLIVVKSEAME